jgi:hypothetical protein
VTLSAVKPWRPGDASTRMLTDGVHIIIAQESGERLHLMTFSLVLGTMLHTKVLQTRPLAIAFDPVGGDFVESPACDPLLVDGIDETVQRHA